MIKLQEKTIPLYETVEQNPENSATPFDRYLQSEQNAPIATNQQLENIWLNRYLDREDEWLERQLQHNANKRFNHQLDLAALGALFAPVLGIAGAEALPFLAPGTVGGTLIGETAGGMAMGELLNKGTEMLTGRNWGDSVRNTLESTFGYNPESWSWGQGAYNLATDMTNPGYWNGSKWLKNTVNGANEIARTVTNDILSNNPGIVQYPRYWYGKTIKYRGAELPTIYRKIKGNSISTDTENVVFTNNPSRFRVVETGKDPLITNFTTDMPVLSHGEGNWDIADTYAIPGNSLLGKRVISTRPSDTFTINDIVKIPKKKVTLITGDPQSITAAQNSGIGKIVSTDRLKEALIRDIADNDAANAGSRFRFRKDDFSRYARMMRNEARVNFRTPTLKDY